MSGTINNSLIPVACGMVAGTGGFLLLKGDQFNPDVQVLVQPPPPSAANLSMSMFLHSGDVPQYEKYRGSQELIIPAKLKKK